MPHIRPFSLPLHSLVPQILCVPDFIVNHQPLKFLRPVVRVASPVVMPVVTDVWGRKKGIRGSCVRQMPL